MTLVLLVCACRPRRRGACLSRRKRAEILQRVFCLTKYANLLTHTETWRANKRLELLITVLDVKRVGKPPFKDSTPLAYAVLEIASRRNSEGQFF